MLKWLYERFSSSNRTDDLQQPGSTVLVKQIARSPGAFHVLKTAVATTTAAGELHR